MPTYDYQCPACQSRDEAIHPWDAQPRIDCPACGRRMTRLFSVPQLSTDTQFFAARNERQMRGHGWYSRQLQRTFYSRDEIRNYCRQHNIELEGLGVGMDVDREKRGPNAMERPYQVAEDIVRREVDQVVRREHGGVISPKKRRELTEATRARLSGKP